VTYGNPLAIWRLRFGDEYKSIRFPGGLVLAPPHLLDAPLQLAGFFLVQRVGLRVLVADVQVGKLLARVHEGAEVGGVGEMREVTLEIPVVALAVAWMVEESIDGKQNLDESRCDNEHQEYPTATPTAAYGQRTTTEGS